MEYEAEHIRQASEPVPFLRSILHSTTSSVNNRQCFNVLHIVFFMREMILLVFSVVKEEEQRQRIVSEITIKDDDEH